MQNFIKDNDWVQPVLTNSLSEGDPDLKITEVSNAERLVRQQGHKIRYCHAMGCWLIFDGSRWRRDDCDEIVELAKETALTIFTEAGKSKGQQAKMLGQHAVNTQTQAKLRAMISLARSDKALRIKGEDLDADPMLLNVLNGTVDLVTGTCRPHCPKDLLTRISKVKFDAEAKCPRWEQFLEEVTDGDKALQNYLARVVGYCLTGRTDEQAFFIMLGGGANGKSVFLNVIQRLLGEYGSTTDFNTFTERKGEGPRADLAKLAGSRLALCSETGPGDRINESVVKQLTGGDEISVRFLYGQYFEYRPQFKIVLATNHLPNILGGHGIWRRVHVVPFNVTFTEDRQDKTLVDKLMAELPGILNWAIAGCLSWQSYGGLMEPATVENARSAYRNEMDSLHAFVTNECVLEPSAKSPASELYASYEQWCAEGGVLAISQTLFGRRLKDNHRVDKHKDGKGCHVRIGIRLKTASEKLQSDLADEPQAVGVPEVPEDVQSVKIPEDWDPFADDM